MGRPSSFTQEKADLICEKIASGQSLRSICEEDEFPAKITVLRWLRENEAFRAQYARAREDQAETIFDEMLEIADDGEFDYETKTRDDGSEYEAVNHDHIQRAKLRIEARKWVLGKMAPKKYGDRIDLNHGGQKDNPITALIAEVSGSTLVPRDDDE